ncbi:hypothetical protein KC19_10G121000 [Ceratodon purpureus]|uniref:Protein kinase domain-containing protein n=1 Tax=Ceratodon purpureus TaxID=3225 RepID=A0A8T0GM48_CERPU|nr:hypothetical protein KC19_10G121000 [Ceratodon purpureus]
MTLLQRIENLSQPSRALPLRGQRRNISPQRVCCGLHTPTVRAEAIRFELLWNSNTQQVTIMTDRKAGVRGLRHAISLQRILYLIAVLLVFLFAPLTCNGQYTTWAQYKLPHLDALQALWGAWNGSTPKPDVNLEGWNSTQRFPCSVGTFGFEYDSKDSYKNWRGVQCLTNFDCKYIGDILNCSALVIGLTLDSASIAGILPPEIGNITTLTTLQLTGNPNLTGILPQELQNNTNIDILNLAGNNFNGSFPHSQILNMSSLRTLDISSNNFEGEIINETFSTQEGAVKPLLVRLDLSNNKFNGTLPALFNNKNLQTLDMSNNKFSGALPNLQNMTSLRSVNLSINALTGSISNLINQTQFNSLSVLDLSDNLLTGALNFWNSSDFGTLRELYLDNNIGLRGTLNIRKLFAERAFSIRANSSNSSGVLKVLSLMNNNISNVDYNSTHIADVNTVFRLQGNPYCDVPDSDDGTRCFCTQVCFNSVNMRNDKRKVVIIAAVASGISVLLMIGLAALLIKNKKYQRYLRLQQQEIQQRFEEFEVKPTIFPYNQLRTATRDFHSDMKLGEGAFGAVYKGILPNGHVVAVKQLFAKTNQGIDEFLNEVVVLTGIRHRNLVNLKGCCIREQQRLLVYEYVDNYDIDKILLGPNKALVSWPVRFKMCLGVAHGLYYLHVHAHPRIIHRDIKASNVLLAQNYETKIADFGLAFLFPDEESYIMTKHVAGTKGYLAPEYASYGQLSDKVDVFSFGVLCLEVVSGRRNIDDKRPVNEMYLSKWAWGLLRQDNLMELIDPTMSLQDDEMLEVHRVINVALHCIQNEADQRPSMERVVAMLQGDSESDGVAPQPGIDELDDRSLFAGSGLATVAEVGEFSFSNSSDKGAGHSSNNRSTGAAFIELSEIRVR